MPTGIPMLSRAFKKSADKPITNNTANGLDQQVPQNKEQEPIFFHTGRFELKGNRFLFLSVQTCPCGRFRKETIYRCSCPNGSR